MRQRRLKKADNLWDELDSNHNAKKMFERNVQLQILCQISEFFKKSLLWK